MEQIPPRGRMREKEGSTSWPRGEQAEARQAAYAPETFSGMKAAGETPVPSSVHRDAAF
jgi:hypothetical protein